MFHEILHNVCAHQHQGLLAHSCIHASFSSRLFVFRVFSYFLFPCSQDFLSISFFVYLRHHTPSVHHSFFVSADAAPTFLINTGCSMNVLANTPKFVYSSNLVTFVLLRPSEWATVLLGAWGVNGCCVKQFHRKSFFVIWNGHLLNRNSLGAGACTSFINYTFSSCNTTR